MFELPECRDEVARALAEDLGVEPAVLSAGEWVPGLLARDVTSSAVLGPDVPFFGVIVAREPCVVCGLPVVELCFEVLARAAGTPEAVEVFPLIAEGSRVGAGTPVAEVEGAANVVLAAERTALNFLMVLSGIATETQRWVEAAGPTLAVCDTRKTYPGLRALSKYAVRVGGGTNHRSGLYDMVLIKDNHLRSRSVADAIERARTAHPDLLVEVEADTEEQALEAVVHGADIVLLDNMDDETLALVASRCFIAAADRHRPLSIEASGGVTRERLATIAQAGIDRVSTSAITLARPVDFGLDGVRIG